MDLLERFVKLWKVETRGHDDPDVIVPVSYVTGRDALTTKTKENWTEALIFKEYFPSAVLISSSCEYPFPGAAEREREFKLALLCERPHMRMSDAIFASDMNNSVEEAFKVREALDFSSVSPRRILIITGELHSRSARYIWRKVFPNAEILVRCTPFRTEVENDHPVHDQRSMGRWVASNILRQLALRVLPLTWVARTRHAAAAD